MAVQFRDYYETLGVAKTATTTRSRARSASSRASIIPTCAEGQDSRGGEIQADQRGLRGPERPGEAQEIRSARRGLEPAGRRISTAAGVGRQAQAGEDFSASEAAAMAEWSSSLAAPGSAISSKQFFGGGRGRSAFGGIWGRQRPAAERGAGCRGRHHGDVGGSACMDRRGRFRLRRSGFRTKSKLIRSKFRAACTKVSASVWRVRAKPATRRRKKRRSFFARASGAASGFCGGRQRSCSRGENRAVAGGAGHARWKCRRWRATGRLKIPAGTQGGQRFRLRERGLPSSDGSARRSLRDAQIQIPKNDHEPRTRALAASSNASSWQRSWLDNLQGRSPITNE